MRLQLTRSKDWRIVYTGSVLFDKYQRQPGDFVIWDKTINLPSLAHSGATESYHLEHSGVVGSYGEIMYAGSYFQHGYAESNLKSMAASFSYGPPSFIYRSKHLN